MWLIEFRKNWISRSKNWILSSKTGIRVRKISFEFKNWMKSSKI
jgi:hypothetical protein